MNEKKNPEETEWAEIENFQFLNRHKRKLSDRYAVDSGTKNVREVLLHSPMGLRICQNIDAGTMEIWISPQAKKSVDADLRNFSNRDDYTTVFDRITFPGLRPEDFVECRFDPFHSVLVYGEDRLHLVPLVDQPGVLVWSEAGTFVDLKSDKADTPLVQSDHIFSVLHPDRGHSLAFAAVAGKGEGCYQQPLINARGRSTYARLELAPSQPLIIGGEMAWENPAEIFERLLEKPVSEICAENEKRVEGEIAFGRAMFKDRPELQEQYDINHRILYAGMDLGGAIPGAWRKLYYLLWHMDGSMCSASVGMAGWVEYLRRWVRFQVGNPTETETPVPGRYFGQLVDRHISKQEEWGLFWATWSAFTLWTQTGERQYIEGVYRHNLLEALDWLERLCFDESHEAFGTWYRGENPFAGSHDFGYDAAIGIPQNTQAPAMEGKAIHRWYTRDFNLWMFNVYTMMSAMWPDLAETMDSKAENISTFLEKLEKEKATSLVELEDGTLINDDKPVRHAPGACFMPRQWDIPHSIKAGSHYDVSDLKEGKEKFAHHHLLNFVMMDPLFFDDSRLQLFLDVFLPQCQRSGNFQCMPGSMPENVNCEDGSYHDNRPYFMPIGMMQSAVMGQGLFRLPFGLSVRANNWLEGVDNYEYRGNLFDLTFEGEGTEVTEIIIDGQPLRGTLQLPDNLLSDCKSVTVKQGKSAGESRLATSSVRLLNVTNDEKGVLYEIEAFGHNQAGFIGEPGQLEITDADGRSIPTQKEKEEGLYWIIFEGRGRFSMCIDL